MIHPDNLPKLSPIQGRDQWVLLEDWTYFGYTVPKGFETDLDSIPHIPFIHSAYKGYARTSALLHDYLYRTGEVSRSAADQLFFDLMRAEGVPTNKRRDIYFAVRVGGWVRWNQLRRK